MKKDFLVHFVSLGCAKNLVDSELVLGQLNSLGFSLSLDASVADIIIVNTCGFIESAKKESLDVIFELLPFKKNGFCKLFIVMGCLAQRYAKELEKSIEEIDYIFGVNDFFKIKTLLQRKDIFERALGKKVFHSEKSLFLQKDFSKRFLTTPPYMAWLKIAEGCNRRCSFCAIPHIRGNNRSRPIDSIVTEAKSLVKNGVRELNVIAQDLSQYGKDFKHKKALMELFLRLEDIKELKWIRAFYYYPDELDREFITLMRHSSKICHYLDIPIQHFSTKILKRMNRKITYEEILEKLFYLKNEIPNLFLRTSLLLGHPGETEKDFSLLLEGVKKIKFNYLGAFSYSREEGTASYKYRGQIEDAIKEARVREVYRVQKVIQKEKLKSLLGKTIEVVIEGFHDETDLLIKSRHRGQAPEIDGVVIINDLNGKKIKIGDFVQVEITDFHEYDLIARLV